MFIRFYIKGLTEDSPELANKTHEEALNEVWKSQHSITIPASEICSASHVIKGLNCVKTKFGETITLSDESFMRLEQCLLKGYSGSIEAVSIPVVSI